MKLTAHISLHAQLFEHAYIFIKHSREPFAAEIAVYIPHEVIIEIETFARKHLFPIAQKSQISGGIVRVLHLVVFVLKLLAAVLRRVRRGVGAEYGREHHNKSVGIFYALALGHPI